MHPLYGQHVLGHPGYVMGYAPRRRYGRHGMHGVGAGYPGRLVVGQGGEMIDPSSGLIVAPPNPNVMMAIPAPGMMAPPPGCAPQGCAPQYLDQAQCPTPPGYTPGLAFPTPNWRAGMLAPGVDSPREGQVSLALEPVTTDTFAQNANTGGVPLTFLGEVEIPFKPNRLLLLVDRNNATTPGAITANTVKGQIFCGNKPQQASLGNIPLEGIGAVTAFDTWQEFTQVQPGTKIRVNAILSTVLGIVGETVTLTVALLGKSIQ